MCLKKFCALFAVVVLCFFAFFPLDVDAYDASNSRTLTASEAAEVFGDTLSVKYFDGTEYQTVDAVLASRPQSVYTDYFVPSLETWDTEIFNSEKWLRYDLPVTIGISTNPSYIQVDFSMTCTFKEIDRLVTCVAVCNSASASGTAVSSIYSSATLETFQNGVKTILTSSDNGDYIQACSFGKNNMSG